MTKWGDCCNGVISPILVKFHLCSFLTHQHIVFLHRPFPSTPTRVAWLYGSVNLVQVMDPPCTTPRPSGMFISSRCVSFHSSRDLGLRNPSCMAPTSLELIPAPSDVFSGGIHRLRSIGSWDVLSILSSPSGFKLRPYDLQDEGPVSPFVVGRLLSPSATPIPAWHRKTPILDAPSLCQLSLPMIVRTERSMGSPLCPNRAGGRADVGSLHESYRTR